MQLRQDNLAGDHFSLVGFQTQMKWGEQARVLRLIPGLEHAEFVRFGMIHRNTYINGPTVLRETWQTQDARRSVLRRADLRRRGLRRVGGVGPDRRAQRRRARARRAAVASPPRTTAIGALAYYVSHADPRALSADQHHVRHHAAARDASRGADDGAAQESGPQASRCPSARWPISTRGSQAAQAHRCSGRRDQDGRIDEGPARGLPRAPAAERERLGAHRPRLRQRSVAVPRPSSPRDSGAAAPSCAPADFDHLHIRAFLGDLHKRGNSRASAARKLAAIRTFGRYLRREGILEGDPAALVGTPKREQRLPAHLGEAEMSRLLEMPDASTPLGRRDRAILELFYASGLRLSELVGLDLEDVNLSSRVVRVLGKGGKERIVPFNRTTEAALRAWLKDREAAAPVATRDSAAASSAKRARERKARTRGASRCS